MARILLALQYWQGDRERAGRLARFMADIEKKPCEFADVLLSARFDCQHDPAIVSYLSQKFKVYTSVGKTKLTGHPDGSYGLWHDTVSFVREGMGRKKLPAYDCFLTFEADCVPMRVDWIQSLLSAWRGEQYGGMCLGYEWALPVYQPNHINGNMLLSTKQEHLDRLVRMYPRTGSAWDLIFYKDFKRYGGKHSTVIASTIYDPGHPQYREFVKYSANHGSALYHGDKSAEVFEAAVDGHARGLKSFLVNF